MFYALAIASMVGFAFQNTLLVRYARRMDGLTLALYRNGSFVVTLLPLLILSGGEDVQSAITLWPLFVLSGISGGGALWLMFAAYAYISVGVSRSLSRAITTVLMIVLSWLVLSEGISIAQIIIITGIVIVTVWLGTLRNDMAHLDNKLMKGALLIAGSSLLITATKFSLAIISRSIHPLTGAYFWEISIAIAVVCIDLARWAITKERIRRIPARDICGIALCSAPTLVGTGGFALALSMGPVPVAEAIGCGAVVVSALMAHWLYGEKLTAKQWLAIALILLGIAALKFV